MKIVSQLSNLFRTPVYEKSVVQDVEVVVKRTHLPALDADSMQVEMFSNFKIFIMLLRLADVMSFCRNVF